MPKHKYHLTAVALLLMSSLVFSFVFVQSPLGFPNDTEEGTRAGFPGTLVGADITTDKSWILSESPYIVTSNVTVRTGITLTIDPSVKVQFDYGTSLNIAGRLRALGERYTNIEFEPFSNNPSPRHWRGIKFLDSSFGCIMNWTNVWFAFAAINCTANTSPIITNCTIETSFEYAVYCGEYSTPVIRDCTIKTVVWTGIICDNRSDPTVINNVIDTCLYGIVCYSPAKVRNNTIHKCWIAILCWGDATIDNNTISNFCTDGIQAFHSDPLIKNNYIDGCLGNGTRFTFSNATVLNNTFRSNKVGMDITYEAKGVLANMEGNLVNGIDIKGLYYVDVDDILIDGLDIRSGWSYYSGYLSAQGSVTLYDCKNVTFRNCHVENSMNSVFAANSTLHIYNTTLENAEQSELYLMMGSHVKSYNDSVSSSTTPQRIPEETHPISW
jgi:hypothetical protein